MKNLLHYFYFNTCKLYCSDGSWYDVQFSTAESYASGELNQHNDWESTNNNWGSELTANSKWLGDGYGRLDTTASSSSNKSCYEQNVVQLIVSFKPWNGIPIMSLQMRDLMVRFSGLHSLVGTAGQKGADNTNNTADDDHRVVLVFRRSKMEKLVVLK